MASNFIIKKVFFKQKSNYSKTFLQYAIILKKHIQLKTQAVCFPVNLSLFLAILHIANKIRDTLNFSYQLQF